MQKKTLVRLLAILLIVAGLAVVVLGVMRYRDETKIQNPVVEDYNWDQNGTLNGGEVQVETEESSEDDEVIKSTNGDETKKSTESKDETSDKTSEESGESADE